MNDSALLKISFLASTLGLLILFLVSAMQKPLDISTVGYADVGSKVHLNGTISEKKISKDGHVFLLLTNGESSIKVVIFNNLAKDIECIEVGKNIEIRGTVDEYRGEVELIPGKVSDIKC